jgi:DNA-binding GntR family transcriptional regulator
MSKLATRPDNLNSRFSAYREQFIDLERATDVVRETLREAILDGHLAPGTWLREEEIARELGVSRTPVREALQQLTAIELIEFKPHQGAVVARLTSDDILAIYVVREALEGVSARLAAVRATLEDCQALRDILTQMEDRYTSDDTEALVELDLVFHARMRQISTNRYLDRFLAQVEQAVRRFGRSTYKYPNRVPASIAEHSAIVDAIADHDPVRAEALAQHHMRQARQLRLQMIGEGY